MAPRSEKRPFNIKFGEALKGQRIMYGYARAEDFAPKVEKVTGLKFPVDTLRRIESGRQAATVEQFAAICLTLNGQVPGMLLGRTLGNLADTGSDMGEAYRRMVEHDRMMVEIEPPIAEL